MPAHFGCWMVLAFRILDTFGFSNGCWMLSCSGSWIVFGFSDIDWGSSWLSSQDIGCFRLLIQRCKRRVEMGNLFDQGRDSPDESKDCPTNGDVRLWAGLEDV